MPRFALDSDTPNSGDCFFHVIAHAKGKNKYSIKDANAARREIAAWLASKLFANPHDSLQALTDEVLNAADAGELAQILPAGTPLEQQLTAARPQDGVGVARNGAKVPLAAWVVWLQYGSNELKNVRQATPGCQYLIDHDFLQYTLWGELGMVGLAVADLYQRPIAVYSPDDRVEKVLVDPINFFVLPSHFAVVRFVSEEEIVRFRERSMLPFLAPRVDSKKPVKKCDQPERPPCLFLIPPGEAAKVGGPRFVQYADPGISGPEDPELALIACDQLLAARKAAMLLRYEAVESAPINLTNFPDPPVYIISSNRAGWLLKNIKKGTWYGRFLGGGKRAVIIAVGAEERKNYETITQQKGQTHAEGLFVVSFPGGWGIAWNRHCALRHAKSLKAPYVWMLDDNVELLKRSEEELNDLPDEALEKWTAISLDPHGIMQQVLGFNLAKLGPMNFCPAFAYSKEDLTLQTILGTLLNEYYFLDQPHSIIKTDKSTIALDQPNGMPGRVEPMAQIASLPIWCDSGEAKPLDLQKDLGLRDYIIMKYQEQALYNVMIELDPERLLELAKKWFHDAASK